MCMASLIILSFSFLRRFFLSLKRKSGKKTIFQCLPVPVIVLAVDDANGVRHDGAVAEVQVDGDIRHYPGEGIANA